MSQVDQLKDQLKSAGQVVMQKIQESPAYSQALDRYENLTPVGQKVVWALGAFTVVFVLLFYPLSNLSTSQESLSLFEEKRQLIRDLFRTYREASATPPLPVPPGYEGLNSSVQSILSRAELLPEQNLGIMQSSAEGRLIPANLVSYVLELKLTKLNIKQITDIGASLAGLSESVKLKDLVISATSSDTRYFDVTYKLYALKVPEAAPEPPPEPESKSNKKSNSEAAEKSNKGLDE